MRGALALSPLFACSALTAAVLALALGWLVFGLEPVWPSVVLAIGLSWLAWIDIDRFLLPDILTLGLLICGLGMGALAGWEELLGRVIGAAAGYAVLAGTAHLYKRFRGMDGLGGGDAKLLAAGGAWVGWMALPVVLLVASLAGVMFAVIARVWTRQEGWSTKIPFGPFLAFGVWIGWIAPSVT